MRPIAWETLSPNDVEEAVSGLLIRVVKGARRVDGSGGDDGADVIAVSEGSQHVYEIKSFTGRLNASRKTQIAKSLKAASDKRSNMTGWTLVLPIDLTPAEQRWFDDELATTVQVPIQWLGRTWLDVQFAERSDLERAFVPGGNESKALEMLASYQLEKAALGNGVPDAIERAQTLRSLTDTVDPDYAFDLAFTEGATAVTLRPKDADAPSRRPIAISLGLEAEVGTAAAQDIGAFHRFGSALALGPENVTNVHLSLPGGLTKLIPEGAAVSVTLTPNPGPRTRVRVSSIQDGRATQSLTMILEESTRGNGGGQRIVLIDDANILRMEYLVDSDQSECKISLKIPADTHAGDAAQTVSFLADMMKVAEVRIEAPGATAVTARLGSIPFTNVDHVEQIARDLKLLERLQFTTGQFLGVPRISDRDRQMLEMANELWTGNSVTWGWFPRWMPIEIETAREWGALPGLIPRVSMTGTGPETLPIAETTVSLPGPLTMRAKDLLVGNMFEIRRRLKEKNTVGQLGVLLVADDKTSVTFSAAKV